MDRGKIVELGATEQVLRAPGQEVTRRLISATPRLSAAAQLPRPYNALLLAPADAGWISPYRRIDPYVSFFHACARNYFDEMRLNPQISRETVAALRGAVRT